MFERTYSSEMLFSLPPDLGESQVGFVSFYFSFEILLREENLFSWENRQELIPKSVEDFLPTSSLRIPFNGAFLPTLHQSPSLPQDFQVYLCLPLFSSVNLSTSPHCCIPTFFLKLIPQPKPSSVVSYQCCFHDGSPSQ